MSFEFVLFHVNFSNCFFANSLSTLISDISSLKSKRDRATTEMDSLSRKNDEYDAEIDRLTVKKRHVQERLGTSKKEVDKLDKTISDAEATYAKVVLLFSLID